jgi:hypothetical protein
MATLYIRSGISHATCPSSWQGPRWLTETWHHIYAVKRLTFLLECLTQTQTDMNLLLLFKPRLWTQRNLLWDRASFPDWLETTKDKKTNKLTTQQSMREFPQFIFMKNVTRLVKQPSTSTAHNPRTELSGFSPQENFTDRASAACRRS